MRDLDSLLKTFFHHTNAPYQYTQCVYFHFLQIKYLSTLEIKCETLNYHRRAIRQHEHILSTYRSQRTSCHNALPQATEKVETKFDLGKILLLFVQIDYPTVPCTQNVSYQLLAVRQPPLFNP